MTNRTKLLTVNLVRRWPGLSRGCRWRVIVRDNIVGEHGTVSKVWWCWWWWGVGSFKVHGTFPLAKIKGVDFRGGHGIVLGLICHTLNTKGQIKVPSSAVLFRRLTVVGWWVNQLSFCVGVLGKHASSIINIWHTSALPKATEGGVNISWQET